MTETIALYTLLLEKVTFFSRHLHPKKHKPLIKILRNDAKEIRKAIKHAKKNDEPFTHLLACLHILQAEQCMT